MTELKALLRRLIRAAEVAVWRLAWSLGFVQRRYLADVLFVKEKLRAVDDGEFGSKGEMHPPKSPAQPIVSSFLFVCQGNICRSPYAETRFQMAAEKYFVLRVGSAGLATDDGKHADETATSRAILRGVSLESHRSKRLSLELIRQSDLVVVMTRQQLRDVQELLPQCRILLLGALSICGGWPIDIADPYGRGEDVFDDCFAQIDFALDRMLGFMKGEPL